MEKKKTALQILAIVMLTVFTALMIVANVWQGQTSADEILYIGNDETVVMNGEEIDSMPKNLTFAAESLSDNKTLSVKIQATVQPERALNRLVDWSYQWSEGATRAEEAVTDYLTVTPDSDGSRNVTVTCLKPFQGDTIILTVTTREGGFTANCTIGCRNSLQSITVENKEYPKGSDKYRMQNTDGEQYYLFRTGETYEFPITGTDSTGAAENGDYAISASGILGGKLYTQTVVNSPSGQPYWTGDVGKKDITNFFNQYVTVTIENNTLKIETKGDPMNILGALGGTYYYEHPDTVISDTEPPFENTKPSAARLESFYNEFLIMGESMKERSYFRNIEIQNGYGVINSIESMNANELGREVSGGNTGAAIFYVNVRETESGLSQKIYFWILPEDSVEVTGLEIQPSLTLTYPGANPFN